MHNQMEKGADKNRSLWSLRPKWWGPNVKIAHSIDCRPYVMEEDNDPDYRYESLPLAETSITSSQEHMPPRPGHSNPTVLVVLVVLVELVFGLRSLVFGLYVPI
jgi:hypothetical protein